MLKNILRLAVIVIVASVYIPRASASDPPGTDYPLSPITLTIEASPSPPDSWWCGPAAMQAAIRWNTGTRYEQRTIWDFMRDHTCGWLGGRDFALPGTVGDESGKIRMMNISKDFGVDPHAVAWGMKNYNPGNTYHYYIYNSLYEATRWLLQTVETYHQPVITVVGAGNHNVDVVGYNSERLATDSSGPGSIYRVYYYDSMYPGPQRWKNYQWEQNDWGNYFRAYQDNNSRDPEPTTGWYITPPSHWHGGWVTVERDDVSSSNPDQALTRVNGQVGFLFHRPLTYLPDLKGNHNGWDSNITIRNNAGSAINATITFYDANGAPVGTLASTSVNANGVLARDASSVTGSGFKGSAVVAATGDVAVVVENQKSARTERTNYTGVLPSGGSAGWEQTGATLYAPVIKRQSYGRSSVIHVTNAGAQSTNVYVVYYNDSGADRTEGPYALNPNGRADITPTGSTSGGCAGAGTVCSAKVYSSNNQPLAGVVRESNDAGALSVTTHNLFSAGATSIYFPLVKYNRYNHSTGLRIQNVGGSGATITVNYYQQSGAFQCSRSQYAASMAAKTFYESGCPGDNFVGSAVATASQRLVGMANEVSTDGRFKKGYSSFQGGTHTIYAPLVYHNFLDGYTWDSGIAVLNLSDSQPANVSLYYYDINGNALPGNPQPGQLNSRGMGVFFAPQSGFKGSVKITTNQDIVAVVNVVNDASSGDTHAIYNASNR